MKTIERIVNALLPSRTRQGARYTTVIYPSKDKAVVWHDGLGILAERSWYKTPEELRNNTIFPAFSNSQVDLLNSNHDRRTGMDDAPQETWLADQLHNSNCTAVNPATGLPMLDGVTDVMGNPLGIDLNRLDGLSNETSGPNFDVFDSYGGVLDFLV